MLILSTLNVSSKVSRPTIEGDPADLGDELLTFSASMVNTVMVV